MRFVFKKIYLLIISVFFSIDCLCALHFTHNDAKSLSRPAVAFINPCYMEQSQVKSIDIPNGSMLNFSSKGVIGATIRTASDLNDIPNLLGVTHSGVVINEDPKILFENILAITESHETKGKKCLLSEKESKAMIDEIKEIYGSIINATYYVQTFYPFSLESDGSAGEVLRGIPPHVHFHDLGKRLLDYDGSVHVRPLIKGVDLRKTRAFYNANLGRDYESVFALGELLKSPMGLNRVENTKRVFCSELAALFYRDCGLIPADVNVSNVIPEQLSSYALMGDLLHGVANIDIALKIVD